MLLLNCSQKTTGGVWTLLTEETPLAFVSKWIDSEETTFLNGFRKDVWAMFVKELGDREHPSRLIDTDYEWLKDERYL